jgi:hypothetical protein
MALLVFSRARAAKVKRPVRFALVELVDWRFLRPALVFCRIKDSEERDFSRDVEFEKEVLGAAEVSSLSRYGV